MRVPSDSGAGYFELNLNPNTRQGDLNLALLQEREAQPRLKKHYWIITDGSQFPLHQKQAAPKFPCRNK